MIGKLARWVGLFFLARAILQRAKDRRGPAKVTGANAKR